MHLPPPAERPLSRRELLRRTGLGFGSLALCGVLGDRPPARGRSLLARPPHYAPRVRRVVHLFMNGGPSQVDTFDPKPALARHHGEPLVPDANGRENRRVAGAAHASPFRFDRHGDSGLEISELFPCLARSADRLCVIRSMVTDVPNHEPGLMMMNCGDVARSRPSVGAWALYGLGTENRSLPGFVAMCPDGLPTAESANWRSSFLPGVYQGTYVDTRERDVEKLVANVRNEFLPPEQQRRQLRYIQQLNELHRRERAGDPALDARIESLELAFRMQAEATDAFDVEREPAHVREMYGDTLRGRQMLIARRLLERGVRYVQVYHGRGQPWDSHNNIAAAHRRLAAQSDRPVAALLEDLAQRGMLDDTLVIWGGEMGRTPTVQLPLTPRPGRDHHHDGFTVWLAGGGVRPGHVHGATDELGLKVVDGKVHVHDLHATILHLLGFDHERLTYRYAGRDFRLTDVHGRVVREILA